jgi:hypothetical protein
MMVLSILSIAATLIPMLLPLLKGKTAASTTSAPATTAKPDAGVGDEAPPAAASSTQQKASVNYGGLATHYQSYREAHQKLLDIMTNPKATSQEREEAYRRNDEAYRAYRAYGG